MPDLHVATPSSGPRRGPLLRDITALPGSPDRIWLRGFWGSLSIAVIVVAVVVLPAPLAGVAALSGFALAILGLTTRPLAWFAFRIWRRLWAAYSRILIAMATVVWFYSVVVSVGLLRSRARGGTRGGAGWTARRSGSTPVDRTIGGDSRRSWLDQILEWSAARRAPWLVASLPFFLVINFAMRRASAAAPPPDIYTLY